jgi:UDPglucose 6-dehydrogenase
MANSLHRIPMRGLAAFASTKDSMNITIVGTGYVGLVTAACFADVGNSVLCLDLDAEKILKLQSGRIPIHEPGLEPLVKNNYAAGRLHFSTNYDEAVSHGDIIFLAVGTPAGEDGSADLSHILSAARSIGERMKRRTVIINKSTVPVGTADEVRRTIAEELAARKVQVPFSVISNPEFLKEGSAVDDFSRPDRIIIGADNADAVQVMRELYAPFNRNRERLIEMDIRSAELTKYAANGMLAARISFMNEIANLADALGADIESVRHGLGADPRIGPHFLYAGIGYGGSCFPKDVKALRKTLLESGCEPHMLTATEAVNEKQRLVLFNKICRHFGGREQLRGKTFALWGLAFKPNTNDMREAPSLVLIDHLLRAGCIVQVYDPVALEEARQMLLAQHGERRVASQIRFSDSVWGAVEGADALAVMTEWKEFRSQDLSKLAGMLSARVVFDGRNIYQPRRVNAAGLSYYGIGRQGSTAGLHSVSQQDADAPVLETTRVASY